MIFTSLNGDISINYEIKSIDDTLFKWNIKNNFICTEYTKNNYGGYGREWSQIQDNSIIRVYHDDDAFFNDDPTYGITNSSGQVTWTIRYDLGINICENRYTLNHEYSLGRIFRIIVKYNAANIMPP